MYQNQKDFSQIWDNAKLMLTDFAIMYTNEHISLIVIVFTWLQKRLFFNLSARRTFSTELTFNLTVDG